MKQYVGHIIIAAAIVIAAIIYAFATRYSYYPSTRQKFDRWTGNITHH